MCTTCFGIFCHRQLYQISKYFEEEIIATFRCSHSFLKLVWDLMYLTMAKKTGRNMYILNSHINGFVIDSIFLYFMVETNGRPSPNCLNMSTLRKDIYLNLIFDKSLNWIVQGGAEITLFTMFSNRKHVHTIILWVSMCKRLGKMYSVPVQKVNRHFNVSHSEYSVDKF